MVETTRAIAASKLVEIVGEPEANPVTGTVDFKLLRLNSHTTQPGLDRTNMIALQATLTIPGFGLDFCSAKVVR